MMLKQLNLSLCFLAVAFSPLGNALGRETVTRPESVISLDGITTTVSFNDGDTLKALDGEYKGSRFRLEGYNTLETYGRVHSWLDNSEEYLAEIANRATQMAQQGSWSCLVVKGIDTYGRRLMRCDDLALALIRQGYAHAYSIDTKRAAKKYLAAQMLAQKEGLGMWAGGVPENIITSLHSISEGHEATYNRLISTSTGSSTAMHHDKEYATCEKVCIEEGKSCMIFIPYKERYGRNRAECLYHN